jgi:hypothetical protein
LLELLPVYLLEKWMVLHFFNSAIPKPVLRFSLDESIDKVDTFFTPPIGWDLIKLNLFSQYFFPNFLSIGTNIGALHKNKTTLPVIN